MLNEKSEKSGKFRKLQEKILDQLGISRKSKQKFQYLIRDGEAYITGYAGKKDLKNSGKNSGIEIPAYIEDCPVVSLAGLQDAPFSGVLQIPATVRELCDMCFEFQDRITRVIIPDSVQSVGEYVFSFCDGLEEIIFPDSLERLSFASVSGCERLRHVHLPENLTEIPDCFMLECPALEEIVIPERVGQIGGSSFSGCEHLRYVRLPKQLKYISEDAFSECPALEKPAIPDGCEVHPGAFH